MKALKYFLVWLLLVIPFLVSSTVFWYLFREELLELGIGLMHILVVVVIVPTTLLLLFYFLSWRLLLRWYGAQEVRERDLLDRAQEIAGDEVKVRLFTADIGVNALCFGGARNGFVVLSPSLLDLLDNEEIDAVLNHEIRGLKDKHSMVYTVVAFIAGVIVSIPTLAFWGSLLTGFGQEDDPAPNLIRLFVMSIVSPFAAFLTHLVVPTPTGSGQSELQRSIVKKIGDGRSVNFGHLHLFLVKPMFKGEERVLDFNLPNYVQLFSFDKPNKLRRPLIFSFVSYMVLLFGIIALDTFINKDFAIERAAGTSLVYISSIVLFLSALNLLLRRRRHSVQ